MNKSTLRAIVAAFLCANLTLLALPEASHGDDFVWRSSKSLRVRSAAAKAQSPGDAARQTWERVEYPQLVQRLRSESALAHANIEFWEQKLNRYKPLRFTDATQSAIKHAENSLLAAQRRRAELKNTLFLVQRYRVELGQLREQMARQGSARIQLDRQ